MLRIGDRGAEVARLQSLLNRKLQPSPRLKEDGVFGKNTDRLVKRYQALNNLGIDGVVGPKTWMALRDKASREFVVNAPVMVTATAPWMKYARDEVDQKEIRGSQHNPRILAYHATTSLKANNDETAWCSSFVNWCLKKAGIKGTNSAAAASWLGWGRGGSAKSGAITVIYNKKAINSGLTNSGNHVGFLIQETSTHFHILGGNQGNQVKISKYPKSSWVLKGYRWPAHG